MRKSLTGSIYASFLFFSQSLFAYSAEEISALAIEKNLHQSKTWRALLHTQKNEPSIHDQKFLLSHKNFSLKQELVETINYLTKFESCNFPARRMFILNSLSLPSSSFRTGNCPDYQEFLEQVPIDNIDLVYTSENLTQPSSMMGHIMLKMSGARKNNVNVSHAISFFTELNSINVPKIIWDSLVTGKEGYFQVSPYQPKVDYYLNEEQRSIWEYQLELTTAQTKLIQAHLWELKTAKLDYFFHTYNCATVTQQILAIASPALENESQHWLTPVDVVKNVAAAGMINKTRVIPSNKWQSKMLQEALSSPQQAVVNEFIDTTSHDNFSKYDEKTQFLMWNLAKSVNDLNYQKREISQQQWHEKKQEITRKKSQLSKDYVIDLTDYRTPLLTPPDSQLSAGYVRRQNKNWLKLSYLPASHKIEDDNRQFFSENELSLSSISLLVSADDNNVKLDEWLLYSVRSLVPWDKFTRGVSGNLKFGFEQHHDQTLDTSLAANISGGLGYTYALSKDLNVFAMLNLGVGVRDKPYLYSFPEVGAYIYEIFDMKTQLSFKLLDNQRRSQFVQKQFSLNQSLYFEDDISFIVKYQKTWNNYNDDKQVIAEVKYQF
ncbi:DUF4105 domain-containing protein [Endozoicomonas sp. G2_1]|uniref:Lnb N-terminal periplasmic domain-containing protein n=1 Tax=Endozoicomonas sp. G2_1 TaxID=2821091 RepID=UPI001ADD571E|nr:DUF4105 domain-containing protein [Endozoicomonas sp. G2_1]MBO9491784.1 DUF4105 domain-containing protein [Endozoicomonas sp. G2_1]